MGTNVQLIAGDGFKLSAYRADAAGSPRGAIVVVQEIFGVNSHIKSVADGYAADGYLVVAPAMFDRAQRNYDTGYSPPEIEAGRKVMQGLDWNNTMKDVAAAVAAARSAGKVGMVGYCWGGLLTWRAAAKVSGLSAAAPYYGGGMTTPEESALAPKVPVLAHFGNQDHWIPLDTIEAFKKAHPEVEVHVYESGHGFNCDQRGSYNADAAKLARERTLAFFAKHLA